MFHNAYKTNNNVIVQLTLLDVREIINVFLQIKLIYVNQLIMINVLIFYILHYVLMDNVDNQLMIVLHNLFAHHNSFYVLI